MNPFPCITTSWDDGHPLDLRLADLLHKHQIAATFYVPRFASTGVMGQRDLARLASGFEIGAHTLHHVFLDRVDDAMARREIADSKTWVEQATGAPCAMFCPPAGKFRARHLDMTADAGFAGFRTVELLSLDRPRQVKRLRLLPTTLQVHPHGWSAYARNALRRRSVPNLLTLLRHGRCSGWTALARVLLGAAERSGGVFHLWGHSWEIEQNQQWRSLEEILRLMADLRGKLPSVANQALCRRVGASLVAA